MSRTPRHILCAAVLLCMLPTCVLAQSTAAKPQPKQRKVAIRGFGDIGFTTFTASQSFKAILGTSSGPIYGGGAEAVFTDRLGISFRFSHFSDSGERAFMFNGQRFGLGIPVRVTVTPLMMGVNYRFKGRRIRPYVGGGVGVYRYSETADFAESGDNVDQSSAAYQVDGGMQIPLNRWFAVGVEARWVTVPGALGKGGISADLNETDLGGFNVAAQVIVGR